MTIHLPLPHPALRASRAWDSLQVDVGTSTCHPECRPATVHHDHRAILRTYLSGNGSDKRIGKDKGVYVDARGLFCVDIDYFLATLFSAGA